MRILMWITVGFACACAIGAYVYAGNLLVWGALAALIAAVILWLVCRGLNRKPIPALILIGFALGLVWYLGFQGEYLSPAGDLDGVTTKASVELIDYCFETDYGVAADGITTWQGNTYRVRVYLNDRQSFIPGDIVSGTFRFQITHDGEKEATYHRGNGIALLAYQSGDVELTRPEVSWWYYAAAHIRQNLLQLITDMFPDDTESFARALLLGDDNDIGYELNTAFKVTGIRHIIAVSGLHISILFAVIYLATGKHRIWTALIGIPVLCLFALVAGASPSVIRACIMHGLMMLAMLFDREYDPPTALAFSVLVMLALNPLVITSVSFQLSVSCMAGIFLFAVPIRSWLLHKDRMGEAKGKSISDRAKRMFAGSVSVSLGAISLSTPFAALYFGAVSLISPLTNLLTLWIVTMSFYGIMASCAVGLLWLEFGTILAGIISWPIRAIVGICTFLAKIPMAAVYTQSHWIVIWLLATYLLLAVFLLRGRKQPLGYGCTVVILLCATLLTSWIEPWRDAFRMTVLDVGQGQSIILQSEGRTFVVDCGGDYTDDAADITAETLLSMGVSRIDGLILTHYDEDHAGGAEYLLSRVPADYLYIPDWVDQDDRYWRLTNDRQGAVSLIREDIRISFGDTVITIFAPEILDAGNESSLCVLYQAGDCDIMITGDRSTLGEKLLMHRTDLPDVDVLVAGHHGSKNSTSTELLDRIDPEIVVISVSHRNSYGHPAPELLTRLADAGCQVLRTDRDGTIIIRR